MEMKSALPILLLLLVALICAERVDAGEPQSRNGLAAVATRPGARYKHKHHLLLFLGGLKSVAAVILIKIKIVLVVAAIVAVSMFTLKYLMGVTALPDLPFLHNKANLAALPLPPSSPPQYLPVVHAGPVYAAHDYSSSIPWDTHNSHENYGHDFQSSHENYGHDWSKVGNGGRSLLDLASFLDYDKILSKNVFHVKRKKIRRRR